MRSINVAAEPARGVGRVTGYVKPANHEFAANFLFDVNCLSPFFPAHSRVKEGAGSRSSEFHDRGERWSVTLLPAREQDRTSGTTRPTDTEWPLDQMLEFRLQVVPHPEEDPIGEQGFNVHFTPRWQDMEVEKQDGSGIEYSVPKTIHEAVNLKVQGSNVDFNRYLGQLQPAVSAVGIGADCLEAPTSPNLSDVLRGVEESWSDFRRVLRHRDQPR